MKFKIISLGVFLVVVAVVWVILSGGDDNKKSSQPSKRPASRQLNEEQLNFR